MQEAEQEAFESIETGGHLKKRGKNKSAKHTLDEDEDDFFKSLSATRKLPKFVELLKFKMLTPGMALWGMVTEIRRTNLTVSLPHGLQGRVILENVSDHLGHGDTFGGKDERHLNQYFCLGSYVRCCVVKVWGRDGENTKKKIDLATKVSLVNKGLRREAVCDGACLSGSVKSVEDHGYIIDFGVPDTRGFLKKEFTTNSYLQGAIVDVVVKEMKHDGNAIVTAVPNDVDLCVTSEWSGVDINSLRPGALVNAKIRNVLSDGLIASFLTFFTGTVDPFHLGKALSSCHAGDKVKARILFCDYETKSIGLSLLPHLLKKSMPELPSRGDVFESAVVKRVDPGLGIAVELPSHQAKEESYTGYAHISNLSEDKIDDIRSRFKPGQIVKCRVIGLRQMDGLASISLKPSVVEGTLFDVAEIKAGMKITGIIDKVDDISMLLKISPHLRASIPALHYSDTVHKKSHKKFKAGQTVMGRVLEVKEESKKIIVTLKKSLVETKYPIISSLEDVVAGMRSHGVVTAVKDDRIFVTFFNRISSMIGREHLGLKESQSLHDAFTVGQIVKARVLGVNMKSQRLRVTLLSKQQAANLATKHDTLAHFDVGALVEGTVDSILTDENESGEVTGYILKMNSPDTLEGFGRLLVSHLSDHPVACASLQECISVGTVLKDLVVLEKLGQVQQLKLTNKNSIREAVLSGNMPKSLEDLRTGTVIPGFIASVSPDAVYVRFLDHLTGRARLNQLSDATVTDPGSLFQLNMSVRAFISKVDIEKQQISVSLKQSMCSEISGSYVRALFKDQELAHSLEDDTAIDWHRTFPYGCQTTVTVHGIKDYGILCDFDNYPDVVGLVAHEQVKSTKKIQEGTVLQVTVMDVSKKDGIVDLSALEDVRKAVLESDPKNPVSIGDCLDVTVLQIKTEEGYCVVNLPSDSHPRIGYMCIKDFNGSLMKECQMRQTTKAKVVAMPSDDTGNRLVLIPEVSKKAKNAHKSLPDRGAEIEICINAVHSLYADVTIEGISVKGRLHITQIQQQEQGKESPLRGIILGSKHKAFVIGVSGKKGDNSLVVNVSLISPKPIEWKMLKRDQNLVGYVQEIKGDYIWITYSPFVKGRAFIPDICESLEEALSISSKYTVGYSVATRILSVNPEKHSLDVDLVKESVAAGKSWKPGTLALGYITRKSGAGVDIKLSFDKTGVVNLTDIYPVAVKNALSSIEVGSFVQAAIVSKRAKGYHLSLRKSSGAISGIKTSKIDVVEGVQVPKPSLKLTELSTGATVSGYVKVAGPMGVFITIGRDLEARIKLRQLNDEFVEDPIKEYPPGTFVQGKVMAINDGKIDVTLRTRKGTMNVDGYKEGQIVNGKVKRIEKFGVFISIDDSPVTGLAHMSELSDGYVQSVDSMFKVGQEVQARVIKVDKAAGKISLGLKPSYFEIGDETDGSMDVENPQSDEEDLDRQLLNSTDDIVVDDDDMEDIDQAIMAQQ